MHCRHATLFLLDGIAPSGVIKYDHLGEEGVRFTPEENAAWQICLCNRVSNLELTLCSRASVAGATVESCRSCSFVPARELSSYKTTPS